MKLVIAEKYSYAQNIVKAIQLDGEHFERHMDKANGYMQSQNYFVTWCFGHLLALADINQYPGYEHSTRWTLDELPFFPADNRFHFVVKPGFDAKTRKSTGRPDPGADKQLKIIGDLLRRADTVIAAGDADREGQVIVDLVLRHHHCSLPTYRLWVNDQTPESIARGLQNMKPDSSYRSILDEGLTRTYMDWLYGINLTRLATIKAGSLLRVGRVIVPVVQEIVNRDREIENFKVKEYIRCVSSMDYEGIPLELASKKTFEKGEEALADSLCRTYNEAGGIVSDLKKERKTVAPPKLFSMSKLQAYLENEMTPQQVLDTTQELYQNGLVSYPRTEADYLFPGDEGMVKRILENYQNCTFRNTGGIFKKPKSDTSHYALIPTGRKPSKLSERQKLVYDTIEGRFREVFYAEPMTVDRTTMEITVGSEKFNAKGDVIVTPGWSRLEKNPRKERVLPNFSRGQHIPVNFAQKTAKTTPPKHYSSSELLAFMKNPFKKEEETDVQLGTEATRAGIISNAVNSEYISQKGKFYYAMDKGRFLVDTIEKLNFGIDKRQSLQFAEILVQVRDGKMTSSDAINRTENTIRGIFTSSQGRTVETYHEATESLGKCPICGKGDVVARRTKDGRQFYTCTNNRQGDNACSFFMFQKFQRFSDVIDITPTKMKSLLAGKVILCHLTSKDGKKYDANCKLEINGRWANLTPQFGDTSTNPDLGKCPICGKPVRSRGNFYGCDGYKDGCRFSIGRTMKFYDNSIPMTDAKVRKLLSGNKISGKIKSRSGKIIDAEFVLSMNGRWANLRRSGH